MASKCECSPTCAIALSMRMTQHIMKKVLRGRKHCALAVVRWSQIFFADIEA